MVKPAARGSISRRGFLRLSTGLTLSMAVSRRVFAGLLPVGGVVVLDWMLAESLLMLGITPVGMANPEGFRQTFTALPLPASVTDVGLIYQPNLEILAILRPGVIIITPEHAAIVPSLEQIAPTLTVGESLTPSQSGFQRAADALLTLAGAFGRLPRAHSALASAQKAIDDAHQRIAALPATTNRTAYLVQFLSGEFIRVFSAACLYGEIFERLGLHNAYHQSANAAGYATTDYDLLSDETGALLIYFTPLPASVLTMINTSPVWRALPFRQPGHSFPLPASPFNGGVASAVTFAVALSKGFVDNASISEPLPAHRDPNSVPQGDVKGSTE